MPAISALIKPASGNCNMKCDYCFYRDETSKRNEKSYGIMSEETLKNVLRKIILHSEDRCTIAFQGGEPTLCGLDFFEKAVYYTKVYNKRKIQIDFALQTNGLDINERWCKFFKENHFLIGLSVDGTQKIHNQYRHQAKDNGSTYDHVLKTAEMFERMRVDFNILTVVHHETAEKIEEIYEGYRLRKFMWQQYISCLDPLGEKRGIRDYSLFPIEYGRFLTRLFNLWFKDLMQGKQPFIRQFENYVGILAGYPPESCEQCGICGTQYVIEADGSVYPCDFYALDHYCLGNLNVNAIVEIDAKRKEIKFIQQSYNHPGKCKQCKYFHICRGGCYRNRLEAGEGIEGLNYFCEGYYVFFENCYDRLSYIAKKISKNI